MMMRITKLVLLLSSCFAIFFITSAHAENKLITTPYFQVNLPNEIVLRKVQTVRSQSGVGKTYLYSKHGKDGKTVEYLFAILVKDLGNKKISDKPNYLANDVKETFNVYANKHDRSIKGSDSTKVVKDVKVGNIDFKVLRTPGARMETWAAIHNGQFYRIMVVAEEPKKLDMINNLIVESLQVTDKRPQQNVQ